MIGEVLTGSSLNQALPPRLARWPNASGVCCSSCVTARCARAPRLQALLAQLLNKPCGTKDSDLQGLLLCGLYQLEGTRIPDHAAVAATVGAVAVLKRTGPGE